MRISKISIFKHPLADTTKKDSAKYEEYKSLPLKPARKINFTTNEGSWMSVDVSPDGQTIAFDLMGDLYTVPVSGGNATRLTKGLAYDVHPRYSPDGKKILFISDRSGADNVWCFDMEKKDTVQLTNDNNQYFPDACWTPDGKYVVYTKGRRNIKMYMVYRKGGGGAQLIDSPSDLKTIDPAVSADGRYIYFSVRNRAWNYNAILPQYQVGCYEREKGKWNYVTSRYGSAFTPVLSKDGKWMVYGSRFEDKTGLVLRILRKYDERKNGVCFLEELPYGSLFKIKDGRIFQKGEKLRKRFKCSETHTNLVYLFSPIYEVKPLTEVEKI